MTYDEFVFWHEEGVNSAREYNKELLELAEIEFLEKHIYQLQEELDNKRKDVEWMYGKKYSQYLLSLTCADKEEL